MATLPSSPLSRLSQEGVSVWLDDLSRDRLRSGSLAELVRTHHIVGVTTNPAIFRTSLTGSAAYADQIRELAAMRADAKDAVRQLTTYDVRWACDVLRTVYDETHGRDGYVSIEVDPRSAHDVTGTVAEAKTLARLVDRPNVMIKIPATLAGLEAISAVLAEGISVNVTLIFSLARYRLVLAAFMTGLERARAIGHDLTRICSVASFFVSRVDTRIDAQMDKAGRSDLRGRAALANARLAYQIYEEATSTPRWAALQVAGGRAQRPLWASTGVKDPSYNDTMYVTSLVAPNCVNTMPEATLLAVADHGLVAGDTITPSYHEAATHLGELAAAGVDYDEVVAELEQQGLRQFEDAWQELLNVLTDRLRQATASAEA